MFTTFPTLFSDTYHFSIGVSGLAYIGLGFGFISSTMFSAKLLNGMYTKVNLLSISSLDLAAYVPE